MVGRNSSARLIALAVLAICLAGGQTQASAELTASAAATQAIISTFAADADTRAHEALPTTNFGTRVVLRVDGAADPEIESYLRFTVSGLLGTVQRATLRLHAIDDTVDGPSVAGTDNAWGETTVAWTNRPIATTAVVNDEGPIAAGSWIELDVTPVVSGDGTFSFVLAATHQNGVDFHSRESTSASLRPELVVEALTSNAPVATSPPTISGVLQEGGTLTAHPGTWNGSEPIAFADQWQRCDASGAGCVDVADATGETFLLTQSDVGSAFKVVVTATNADGSGSASSAPTSEVIGAGDVVIAAAGDIAGCSWNSDEATAQLIDSIAPTRVLTLGDNVYPDGADADFASCYEPTWGRHKAKTHPAVGNHEYHTPGAAGYFNYFGAAAGDPVKGYYAFDLGAWRIYALNSNCAVVPCAAGSEQEQWLRADLAAHPQSCLAAYMHHPRFSSGSTHGSFPGVAGLWNALYDHGVDLVLQGHDHVYERFTRLDPTGAIDLARGVRSFVVGTGGAGLYSFGTPLTGSEARSTTHGVLRLTLRDGGYDWAFAPVAEATFTDSGTDTCGGAPPDTTPPNAPTDLIPTADGAASVGLSWTASTDDVGVVAYAVYRDAQLLATTTATNFTDTSAVAGATYDYHVTARDAAGNSSGPSNTVTVTVQTTTIVAFAAEADARVVEARSDKNFGSSSSLRTDGGSDPDVESYLRFDVSEVSGPVQRAILRVYAFNATTDGPAAYGTNDGWLEPGITWSNRPGRTTAAIDDKGAVATNTWVEYDVTVLVSGNGTFSFALATTSTDSVDFHSRDANQTALRPQLVVTFG